MITSMRATLYEPQAEGLGLELGKVRCLAAGYGSE
jgi:hypothetical protein